MDKHGKEALGCMLIKLTYNLHALYYVCINNYCTDNFNSIVNHVYNSVMNIIKAILNIRLEIAHYCIILFNQMFFKCVAIFIRITL